MSEWITALEARFPHWAVHVSPRISLPDYGMNIDTSAFMASSPSKRMRTSISPFLCGRFALRLSQISSVI